MKKLINLNENDIKNISGGGIIGTACWYAIGPVVAIAGYVRGPLANFNWSYGNWDFSIGYGRNWYHKNKEGFYVGLAVGAAGSSAIGLGKAAIKATTDVISWSAKSIQNLTR